MTLTQMGIAKSGKISEKMKEVAENEGLEAEFIRKKIAEGKLIIPANIKHKNVKAVGIGKDLKTKINANIGNSSESSCPKDELEKLETALKYGTDTVMDLSTGGKINSIRKNIIKHSGVPVGTVPLYEAVARVENSNDIDKKLLFDIIREQAEQGVDYMTVHAGVLKEHVPLAMKRKMKIVSRGGSLTAKWMKTHNKQNLLYKYFDELLEICREYDVTLSLGDGLRPGCLADASDSAQFAELEVLGKLVKRCRKADVQCMVEGPGHIPLNEIRMNMEKEDEICDGAPFYILGPVVVDCAPGYDHITSAIGGALGAWHGAAMLCYVTPKEHLGLPNAEDVRNGVIAYKIAAHAADIANGIPGARSSDDAISDARMEFDWEKQFNFALDSDRAREYRESAINEMNEKNLEEDGEKSDHCTMCGPNFCSMKISGEVSNKK